MNATTHQVCVAKGCGKGLAVVYSDGWGLCLDHLNLFPEGASLTWESSTSGGLAAGTSVWNRNALGIRTTLVAHFGFGEEAKARASHLVSNHNEIIRRLFAEGDLQ
ncbi:MAG TPA: hypothetical protein VE053_06945 [Allosphingosinicella sp.]|nr:hypothetical protein [Allosphingosinicella sp.]